MNRSQSSAPTPGYDPWRKVQIVNALLLVTLVVQLGMTLIHIATDRREHTEATRENSRLLNVQNAHLALIAKQLRCTDGADDEN